MGKQVVGALVMFAAIWGVPYLQFADVSAQDLEASRRVLLPVVRVVAFVVLFGIFFVGLKVFAAGLLQERAARASGTPPPA